ncbi:MAG: hypothetical protein JWO56_1663 [Acidobacteria bacterium]|nr:hypothetical protein [Acidobacteriota bacterium]
MPSALILDFDGSVRGLPGAVVVPVRDRQEEIRFGCRLASLRRLGEELGPRLDANRGVVFAGSGDYHHLSYLLIERLRRLGTHMEVVVFDNHPDNMRYPVGIHCGSWVGHVSRLPFVSRVHVVGITSTDVEGAHAIENQLAPLRAGRVVYWTVGRNLAALRRLGVTESRSFATVSELFAALGETLAATAAPLYLSIDKDVLAPDVVRTNWDQGVMRFEELASMLATLQPRCIGSDVVGDVSSYRYQGWFKRLLSRLDRQPEIPPELLEAWQGEQAGVNSRLVGVLRGRSEDED